MAKEMFQKKEAMAFLLEEETVGEISRMTGIDQEVVKAWLQYDQSFRLKSKVIVVTIYKEKNED